MFNLTPITPREVVFYQEICRLRGEIIEAGNTLAPTLDLASMPPYITVPKVCSVSSNYEFRTDSVLTKVQVQKPWSYELAYFVDAHSIRHATVFADLASHLHWQVVQSLGKFVAEWGD